MSKLLTLSSILLAGLGGVEASTVCSNAPYSKFLALSNYPIAETLCSQLFPVAPVTQIITASAFTVTTTIGTTTLPVTISTSTSTTTTSTLTIDVGSTETDTATATFVYTTITNFVAKRAAAASSSGTSKKSSTPVTTSKTSITTSSKPSSTSTGQAALWASVLGQAESFISTVCSCIETPKTVVKTTSPTTTASVTATSYTSVVASTILDVLASTTTTLQTTVTASTVTVSVAATTSIACSSPSAICSGNCVNTNTDNNNCGSCGNACSSTSPCFNGQCSPISNCAQANSFAYGGCPNGNDVCYCLMNTEGGNTCAVAGSSCNKPCSTSADCGGLACLSGSSSSSGDGCGYNNCEVASDAATCGHGTVNKFRVRGLAAMAEFERSVGVVYRKNVTVSGN